MSVCLTPVKPVGYPLDLGVGVCHGERAARPHIGEYLLTVFSPLAYASRFLIKLQKCHFGILKGQSILITFLRKFQSEIPNVL